jgi:transketolase C-terminal domain/subunit
VACSRDSSFASFTDLRERLSGAVIFTYKDNMETIRRTLSTRKLKARRGDTSADDQHPMYLRLVMRAVITIPTQGIRLKVGREEILQTGDPQTAEEGICHEEQR